MLFQARISGRSQLQRRLPPLTDPLPSELTFAAGEGGENGMGTQYGAGISAADYERIARCMDVSGATWLEVAEKARYLIQIFAATPEARDPRRQQLIARVLDDLTRLSE